MRIVIVGDGKVGFALIKQLSKENHDIVVIDKNAQVLQKSMEALDIMVINGNGATLDIQREAEVAKSDLFIAVTSEDEVNLLCCILARKLGCHNTIARVRNPEYSEQIRFLSGELGISMTINPELSAAEEIFRLIQFPSFLKREFFAQERAELVELKIKEGSKLIGKRLYEIHNVTKVKVLICVVKRDNEIFIPTGSFILHEGDKITVTAAKSDLAKLIKNLDIGTKKIRNVVIIGGSRIAIYLSEKLLASGVDVKIIEQNREKCEMLSEKLPEALIINADGSSRETLLTEGVAETDSVVTLTDIDEENLIISMYVEHIGVSKAITKINRVEYEEIFQNKGIGSIVIPKLLSANEIVRYVRDMENTTRGSVITLHQMATGSVEALEFRANKDTNGLGIPLCKLKIKEQVLIACINRSGKIIIPSGNDYIKVNDTVVIVTRAEEMIGELNEVILGERSI